MIEKLTYDTASVGSGWAPGVEAIERSLRSEIMGTER